MLRTRARIPPHRPWTSAHRQPVPRCLHRCQHWYVWQSPSQRKNLLASPGLPCVLGHLRVRFFSLLVLADMTDTDLAFASIDEVARLFRKRKLSPVEVTNLLLARSEER